MSQHKTPLRYPGGKQKLTPFILEVLETNNLLGGHYVEPYAGGAGVAIELLINKNVECIHLNDSSYPIYAFWKSIKSEPEAFCRRISRVGLNIDEWRKQKSILQNPTEHDEISVGFATFYLNRCNRSGVLTGGVIGGLDQQGQWKIDARFPRNELIKRVEAIGDRAKSIRLRNWDAERFIREYIPRLPDTTLVYCDPPYYERSRGLYLDKYAQDDHQHISKVIQTALHLPWIVSYDGVEQILQYYKPRKKFLYNLQYNAAKAYKGTEVFIFSDKVKIPKTSSLPFINESLKKRA
jgi:DNA adenine methylase